MAKANAVAPTDPFKALIKCTDDVNDKLLLSSMVNGARRAMAVMYQDCSVLDPRFLVCFSSSIKRDLEIPKEDIDLDKPKHRHIASKDKLKALIHDHPYLRAICEDTKHAEKVCKASGFDPCETPPIFNYGGDYKVGMDGIDPFYRKPGSNNYPDPKSKSFPSDPATDKINGYGIDCYRFLCMGMASVGRFVEKDTPPTSPNFCPSMDSIRQPGPKSCFQAVTLKKDDSLQPGDLMVFQDHVLMIDSIGGSDALANGQGKDPFGLDRWAKKADGTYDCSNPQLKQLNFNIIEDGVVGDGLGIVRIPASDYFVHGQAGKYSPADMNELMKGACKVAQSNAEFSVLQKHTKDAKEVATLNIVRHQGGKSCTGTPAKIKGTECLKGNCAVFPKDS